MSLHSILFSIVLLGSLTFFGWNARRLIGYLRLGKQEDRFGQAAVRLKNVLEIAFGQTKLLREPLAGL
ncbi:MAG: Fe-S oxidoreductase, partial [Ignavibacteriae bacterium]|nr:Fe-S oxidoreductase [Ignavibacteriota bacterium]